MEVSESKWVETAKEHIDLYLHRGGKHNGDEPQFIGGTDLLNTIGMAMGLPMSNPDHWTEDELKSALKNELCYFVGDARKAIDVIADQIIAGCGGDRVNYVTVLPIEVYHEGKLYEVPLFRVKRNENSNNFYVDNTGRTYASYNDWYDNNKLPQGKMAFPYELTLSLRPGYEHAYVAIADTPSSRPEATVVRTVDTVAAVVGIGAAIGLLFISGGLAAPLVVAGIGSAIWATARSGYQLVDRAIHHESINPITNAESRMLWLGIAANVISFGAMGASMRLTAMAVSGQEISTAFRVFVTAGNTTSLAVNSVAIFDTTVYLVKHYEELSTSDILLHIATIAFWMRGVYTYKTAGTLIRDAHNHAFTHIGNELNAEQAKELEAIRTQFGNDAQLLQEFHRAAESHIPMKEFSEVLIDANRHGQVKFDGLGNIILPGEQRYSFEFLVTIPKEIRVHYFDVITNLNPEELRLFEGFRHRVNNDVNLINGLASVAVHFEITPRQATERVIEFWKTYSTMNLPDEPEITISEGSLVLGRAPPIGILNLQHLSPEMIQFVTEHLSHLDVSPSQQWSTSVPVLLELQVRGMFTSCKVIKVTNGGRAVLMLNNQLQASVYTLNSIPREACQRIFALIGSLPSDFNSSSMLPKELATLSLKNRLRLQCHREESVTWMKNNLPDNNTLRQLVDSQLLNHEQDRLYQFRDTVKTFKSDIYMTEMMSFVAENDPKNISEMVAYSEFVVKYVEIEKGQVEKKLKAGVLKLPPNTNKKQWLRREASREVFANVNAMREKLNELFSIVDNNDMVGIETIAKGLCNEDLVRVVRENQIKFSGRVSAAYHILKHEADPIEAYVMQANEAIRNSGDRYSVTITQDGDARTVRFESPKGSTIILERDGRVFLCTFTPL